MCKKPTFTAEQGREVPELSHVESLKDLTLVASTVTVQYYRSVLVAVVLVRKSQASTDGDLSTDNTVTAVETFGEHVHRTTLSVRNSLTPAQELTNDRSDGTSAHQSETVASVGSDYVVLLSQRMLDTNGHGLLTSGQVAETPDLLLLVQSVGGHFHLSVKQASQGPISKLRHCDLARIIKESSDAISYRITTIS